MSTESGKDGMMESGGICDSGTTSSGSCKSASTSSAASASYSGLMTTSGDDTISISMEWRGCGDGERETQPDYGDGECGMRGEPRATSGVHPVASEREARASAASERVREALRAEQRWRLGYLQSRCGRLMHGNANRRLRMRTSGANPRRGVLRSKTTLVNQNVEPQPDFAPEHPVKRICREYFF